MTETRELSELLPKPQLRNRVRIAWAALRGQAVMYRFGVEFSHAPGFWGEHAKCIENFYSAKDGSMPFFNGVPAAEIIGKGNVWKGWGGDSQEQPSE